MKYDLNIIILEELKLLYGLENESCIWEYLEIRASVKLNKKNLKKEDLMEFVVDELNICKLTKGSSLKYLMYKGEKYNYRTTMSDFIDYLTFRAKMLGSVSIQHKKDEIFKEGNRKSHRHNGEGSFKYYRDYNRLLALNRKYNVNPRSSPGVDGFEKSFNHNPMKRTLEETLMVIIESIEKLQTKSVARISERILEDYLIKNLNLIEDGLVVVGRQVRVAGGVIDILARDKNDSMCIVEIKIAEDKTVVWQAIHYPMEMKRLYGNNIRMIVVAPSYSESLLGSLEILPEVEIFKYEAKIIDEKICNLIMKKLTN